MRRLRRVVATGVAAAGVLATAVGCAVQTDRPSLAGAGGAGPERGAGSPATPPLVPAAPGGSRWVGVGKVAVAVPERWGTSVEVCGEPDGPTVSFVGASSAAVRCAVMPATGVSSLVVADPSAGAWGPLREHLRVGSLMLRTSGIGCSPRDGGACTVVLRVAGVGATLVGTSRADRPRQALRDLVGSVRRTPEGLVAVPFLDHGTSMGRAARQLERAGLKARVPAVDFPHYATGTEPAPGNLLPEGSVVDVTIGDG